eukprot:CAMPEP_0201920350 /NCGR_PEP_ID=MMETSP0903-20130614/8978_1 /ASSEMBLY_ACC=CAM_ASM_000552 /TAXON_ID=420261 /ORGANISM="Thalassiosira antarctica, Strain CCMP982" /LENGTH=516 /DNA_ID=CAMNT_0048457069 /DNA_START=1 /DNA_END=1547 /DNA_ORIENTATION=+
MHDTKIQLLPASQLKMPKLVNVPAAAGGASESTMEEDKEAREEKNTKNDKVEIMEEGDNDKKIVESVSEKNTVDSSSSDGSLSENKKAEHKQPEGTLKGEHEGNEKNTGEESDEPPMEKDGPNVPNNEGGNTKVNSESNNGNIEKKGEETDKPSIDEEGTAKAVSENDKPNEGAKSENTTEPNTETNKRKYEQSNTSSTKKKKEGDEMFNSAAKSMNNTSQQQAGLVPASQQDRFVKISLKLPPVGSGKIGFILQDDKQHYGLPLLMALSPDSPYHDVIPPHLVGHYWVIGVKDEVIGESKILNSKDLTLELYSRRKKNEESLIEMTFVRKSGNANAVSLPSNHPNLPVMLPSASLIPPQMMHPNQTAMIQPSLVQTVEAQQQIQKNFQQQLIKWQLAARHQNQLARAVPSNMQGQQLPANNQANNKPVLPLLQKKQPKSSLSPETNTKSIRDSTIRRALSEFFVEGETRPLRQFCQAYPKLYTAISKEVSKNAGLREMQDKRKTNEAFSKEDGRA